MQSVVQCVAKLKIPCNTPNNLDLSVVDLDYYVDVYCVAHIYTRLIPDI